MYYKMVSIKRLKIKVVKKTVIPNLILYFIQVKLLKNKTDYLIAEQSFVFSVLHI